MTTQTKPATPLPKGTSIPRSFYNAVVRERDTLRAERDELVVALRYLAVNVEDNPNSLETQQGRVMALDLLQKIGERI